MTSFELVDYDGPLGGLEPELARRRIAVASDGAGRVSLVRPDSVVLEFGDDGFEAVQRVIHDRRLDVLGGALDDVPVSGIVAARRSLAERDAAPRDRWGVRQLCELVDDLSSDNYNVQPNHVYVADGLARRIGVAAQSAMESTATPAAPPAHLPAPLDLPGRRRPNVLVLDSGLRTAHGRPEHSWLRDHCVIHSPWRDLRTVGRWDDEDEPDDDHRGRLDVQAGHGTFISGVIRQVCPDARIHHRGVLTSYGDGDDASVIRAIERATRRVAPANEIDIVVMAFGTHCANDRPPPMAGAIRRLLGDALVVASAGNDATSRPCFPAALPGVVAVGALDSGGPAPFSNSGPWVDACASGVNVVSTFFTDFDEHCLCCDTTMRSYRGWARWSGTSFAAPRVAGAVAQEMYLRGGSARDAWARIARSATHRRPGLGVVIAP